jgi:hypothetical protein
VNIDKGVKRGCPLNPMLFDIGIDQLIIDLKRDFIRYGLARKQRSIIPVQRGF